MTTRRYSRIAFGSCNEQSRENKMWSIIESRKPAAFVWGGDSIYADSIGSEDTSSWSQFREEKECARPDRVRWLYERQRENIDYRRLVESNMTIFGTIDDHDYGCDNGDKNYPHKYETTNAFIDFLGEPIESPMAQRAASGLGVYGVKLFDFDRIEGQELVPDDEACIDPDAVCSPSLGRPVYSNKTVAVFVLDVRTNKDPWLEGNHAYYPSEIIGDFLGPAQWEWFEEAISNSRAAVNVVVNGLQVNANIFSNPNVAESWSAFPRSQQRLMDAILGDSAASTILISGDVHMTQLMRKDCRKRSDLEFQRPVVEMTTSGMTHSWGRVNARPLDKPDHHPSVRERIEVFVGSTAMHILHQLRPWTQLMISSDDPNITHDGGIEGAKTGLQYSLERNFGELEFDWEGQTVSLRSIGEDGRPLLSSKIRMDQLSGKSAMSTSLSKDDFDREVAEQHPLVAGEWVCLPYRGRVGVMQDMLGHVRSVLAIVAFFTLPFLIPAYLLVRRRRRGRTPQPTCARTTASSKKP